MAASRPRIVIGRDVIDRAARTDTVRKALADKADRILPRAKRLALSANMPDFAAALHREDGTRPGTKSEKGIKRPFSRVIADNEAAESQEHGNVGVPKAAILRRAMGA